MRRRYEFGLSSDLTSARRLSGGETTMPLAEARSAEVNESIARSFIIADFALDYEQ